ncbi:MAG: hypothetical protein QNJ13_17695 [Paracoccaceae bacterium]|nr:hypothetical protein [Paracoccaceae bacterium]
MSGKRLSGILSEVQALAVEYKKLTGKPLGVTGELAECHAARHLGLDLAPARTNGFDALRGDQRVQIKGRVLPARKRASQMMGTIKRDAACDRVVLVLLDGETLDPAEMWEAPMADVTALLDRPGSKARARGSLAVTTFKSIAEKVWPL